MAKSKLDFQKYRLAENLVTIWKYWSAVIGHITRLINKISENYI